MRTPRLRSIAILFCTACALLAAYGFQADPETEAWHRRASTMPFDPAIEQNASRMIQEGRQTFRFDTFGSEAFWGGLLRLHEAILGEALGGVGTGVSPQTALAVGLKVDAEAVSRSLFRRVLRRPNDPAVTVELLRENAVVGVTGKFEGGQLRSIGIQCALCHSTVDNSVAPGIGRRLDGWANRDLNIGAIVALAPSLEPLTDLLEVPDSTVRRVLNSWGPGKFDAELVLDGKAFRPDGGSAATLIPPAFGLAGVNLHTWTGWGSVTHWNAFVSNLEMHGQGTFYDPRLNDASKFPIAAKAGFGNVRSDPDLITGKLAALHFYQLSIPAPTPSPRSFNAAAAERGEELFNGRAECATCHVPPIFTEPGWNMHTPEEIGIDAFQAERSPDGRYRTAPLKGLWTHTTGGFYHDGRFATLNDVVDHYDDHFSLGLSDGDRTDLVQYLMSLGDSRARAGRWDDDDDDDGAAKAESSLEGALPGPVLKSIRPNPSAGEAAIVFDLEKPERVDLAIFDVQGREVAMIARGQAFEAGEHRVVWSESKATGRVAPGVYFVRLRTDAGEWRQPLVRMP
jgi:hypothetical protein